MSSKHERIISPNLFYAFVDFGKNVDSMPVSYVVPSAVVADVIKHSHTLWLSTPGKAGQQRKDGDFRRFLPNYDKMGLSFGHGAGWLNPVQEAFSLVENAS